MLPCTLLPTVRNHSTIQPTHITIITAVRAVIWPIRSTSAAARCTLHQLQLYRSKISGPLLDRIDIHVEVPAVPYKDLTGRAKAEGSAAVKQRVAAARAIQQARFKRTRIHRNARMGSRHIRKYCTVDTASSRLLETAVDKLGLSPGPTTAS